MRAIPSAVLTSVVGLISLPVLLAAPERTHGPFARSAVVVVPLLVLLALATAAMLATALFNRPKWLVAPHLREQEGAAVEIWNRLKSRRRSRRR